MNPCRVTGKNDESLDERLIEVTRTYDDTVVMCCEATVLCSYTIALVVDVEDQLKVVCDLLKYVVVKVENQEETINLLKKDVSWGSS